MADRGIFSQALADAVADAGFTTAEWQLSKDGPKLKVGAKMLTARDFTVIGSKIGMSFTENLTNFEGQVLTLIMKARPLDADGQLTDDKAFTMADKPMLMSLPAPKIWSMFMGLFEGQVEAEELTDDADPAKEGNASGN